MHWYLNEKKKKTVVRKKENTKTDTGSKRDG